METNTAYIENQTRQWIKTVVIGCGFCPFAAKPFIDNKIRYRIISGTAIHEHSKIVLEELQLLDKNTTIETSLLIFADAYAHFSTYLRMVKKSEDLIRRKGYEGIYQIASFHPLYLFGDSDEQDAANYTNRSPYPMLHLLREDSLSRAIAFHPSPEAIPARNVAFARSKGLELMAALLTESMR